MFIRLILPFSVMFAGAVSAQAVDPEYARGADEFIAACAACHGENADGKGPIATMFKGEVPDLTTISARNDGKFPTLEIFQIIDGRSGVAAHGAPMPIFGRRFSTSVGEEYGPYGSEPVVRARVLELVFYLQSIQK